MGTWSVQGFNTGFFKYMFAACLMLQLTSCENRNERTTGVYGTVTDPGGKPLEGVKVLVYGSKDCGPIVYFGEDYTDTTGDYNITFEASKDFDAFNTVVPLSKTENSEFFKTFNEIKVKKNEESVEKCCFTSPGDKTRYDFKLVSK
jgi:hypothetical protein